jgi:hypothetical protein
MNMGKEFAKIRYYVVAAMVMLGVFAWAGFTGRRLLGDDNESQETTNGYYGRSGYSGGHGTSRFYHK